MSDHTTLGTLASGLYYVHSDARRTRGKDRIRRRGVVHLREQLNFELRTFGCVFLNKVGVGERLSHTWFEGQAVTRCAGSQAILAEGPPGFINILAKAGLGIRHRIGCSYVESARQVVCGPASADNAGADNCDAINRFVR